MEYNAAEIFEKFSFDYLKIREQEYNHSEQLHLLSHRLNPVKNKKIIDLGCGSGVPVLKHFHDQGAEIHGIDISANMISHAKRNFPNGHFIHQDIIEAELKDNFYDAALSFYVLFVLEIKQQFHMFQKIFECLKPGGIAYFTLLCESYTKKKEFEDFLEFMGYKIFFGQTTPEKYKTQFESIGFINIKMDTLTIDNDETCLWVYLEKKDSPTTNGTL